MTDNQRDQREKALCRSNGLCPVCKKPLAQGQMQYAHKIGNTEVNRKKYGSFFIDSTYNGELVCSLGCNSSVDVGKSKGRILDTLADILIKEMKDFHGGE
jgi:hypothetical protein